MDTTTNRHRTTAGIRLATLASAALLALALSSCAAQEPSEEEQANEDAAIAAWQNDYDNCLREQGVEPLTEDSPQQTIEGAEAEAYEAAMEACDAEVGQMPGMDEPPEPGELEEMQKAVECLREQGLEVEDPDPSNGMITLPGDATPEQMQACGLEMA